MFTSYSVRASRSSALGALISLCMLLVGCGGIGIVKTDAPGPAEGESVLVFGVQPPDHGIMLFPGAVEDGKFKPAPATGLVATAISGAPRDGYVVAHAKAGQQLALLVVNAPKTGGHGGQFHVCGGNRALTVDVPEGRVAYVANVEFAPEGSKLNVRYSTHLDAAREYLRKNFPNLKGDVELLHPKLLPTANECAVNSPGTIFIYIRR